MVYTAEIRRLIQVKSATANHRNYHCHVIPNVTWMWCKSVLGNADGSDEKWVKLLSAVVKGPGCLGGNASWSTWPERRPDRQRMNYQRGGRHKAKRIWAPHHCLTAKMPFWDLFEVFYSHRALTIQPCDGETYLGVVGYVMLGQSLRGVHPWLIWNDTNSSLNR